MKRQLSILAITSGLILVPLTAVGLLEFEPEQPDANSTQANLSPSPVHPDESVEDTIEQRFSFPNSLERIEQIEEALESFKTLTEKSKATLGEQTISTVGNTDWETQNLGFSNWVGSVEGTLRKQDYQIKKLKYELAQKQYEDEEITKVVLDEKATSYKQAEQEFQSFLNDFRIAD